MKCFLLLRKKLNQRVLQDQMEAVLADTRPNLDFNFPLAYQKLDSLGLGKLAVVLEPFFPKLAPRIFYRYKTIAQLIEHFGAETPIEQPSNTLHLKNPAVISGMSCRFPSSVETLIQFWDML